jgi:hypothetical protein
MHSAELLQVLEQKPTRPAAHYVKRYATLIETSELNGGEAKLSCDGRDGCAGIGVVARHEDRLPLSIQRRVRSELRRRQMIEGFH